MAFVVAIDGPASAGKGTITKIVAEKMNLLNVDTGAMYRCIALEMLRKNIGLDEIDKIQEVLDTIKIDLKAEDDIYRVYLNGEDVSKEIRTNEVSNYSSPVSKVQIVRDRLVEMQRELGKNTDVIMEGRDIGTNVFPNANVKIYLDADVEERARRRYKQNIEKGINTDYETVLKDLKERDYRDSTREVAPLKQAEDAVYIDSTNMTIDEVADKVIEIVKNAR